MGFALKHRELDSRGSFIAWGVGLEYEYDVNSSVLNIVHSRKNKPLIYIDCDSRLSEDPLGFTSALEKATQINALVFSNKTSVDLSDILKERHLKIMLETAALQASYSFDLEKEDYNLFEERFCKNYCLRKIRVHKCIDNEKDTAYFRGELQTRTQNSIQTCGAKLYSVIKGLSNKTVNDLLSQEYGHPSQQDAQNLLAVSSNLSLISKVLDKNFHPMHKIKQIETQNSEQAA